MPKLINTEKFILKSNLIHSNKYDYSKVVYIKNSLKILIICNKHGDFTQTPAVHLRGGGCNLCNLEKRSISNRSNNDEFIEKAIGIHNNKYIYSKVKYINNKTPVIIVCEKHGDFTQEPRAHILQKQGCPYCSNKIVNTSIFKRECVELHGDYYDYSKVNYISSKQKVMIICPNKHIFYCTPGNHKAGNGCPICRESKGERIIRKYLEDNNIEFKREYRFNDCRYKRPLPFDFYLPIFNICIEFDGEQHFNKFRFEKDNCALEFRKIKDSIKNKFCKEKNIILIRISYLDNILDILSDSLINLVDS